MKNPLKILDRYLIRQFLQTLFFAILAFTLIFVIIDLMEKLDDFIDQSVPGRMILEYYFVFVPEIIRLMIPVSVLLSCLFTVGKMGNLNEVTAIKAAGVSYYRFMLPFVTTAFVISIMAVYFGGYVVPLANKHKVYIEQHYMKKGIEYAGSNIYFQDSPTRIVTISYYDVAGNQAHRISIQEYSPADITKMTLRIDASRMVYDTLNSYWTIYKGIERTFTDSSQSAHNFASLEFKGLNFSPEDIIKKQRKPEEMTLDELQDYAAEQLKTGNDPTRIEIEYHSRIAFGFASLVVILFGLPLSVNKRGGGLSIQIGINLLITFIYLVFMKISQAFGKNGVLDPLPTAWFANFVFLAAAIVNTIRASK